MDYLLLFTGLALLLLGANYLVDASVAIAQRAKISNFIIGLTIVGIGTSAPELFISISSALSGDGDIAVGNVIGSNISNLLLILGATATILPFTIEKDVHRRDIPIGIGAAILLFMLANDSFAPGIKENTLSRIDGIFFLVVFVAYMAYVILLKAKKPCEAMSEADEQSTSSLTGKHPALLWAIALASLGALVGGGQVFLESAKTLAKTWGMSDAVISITIVAVGTSLPELITAIIAACKKNADLALGNVMGSNIFNILMILGVAATIRPLEIQTINVVDYLVMIAASAMTFVVVYTFKKKMFDRAEGIIFLTMYVAYTVYLFLR